MSVLLIAIVLFGTVSRAKIILGRTSQKASATATKSQSLLAGMTPSSLMIPSGWVLAAKEDFEAGLGPNEEIAGEISTAKAHSGSHAMGGLYQSDGDVISLNFKQAAFGSYTDIYVSYWDWEDANALIPAEIFIADVSNCTQSACPITYQDFGFDWAGQFPPKYLSSPSNPMLVVTYMLGTGGNDLFYYPPCDPPNDGNPGNEDQGSLCVLPINAGSWRQYEIWWHPNTENKGQAKHDGFIRLYVDGRLTNSLTNFSPNGRRGSGTGNQLPTMQNPDPSAGLAVGGVITALCGSGRANPFSVCSGMAPKPFHRYIDDVILMKK